jgi:hypothetical protein
MELIDSMDHPGIHQEPKLLLYSNPGRSLPTTDLWRFTLATRPEKGDRHPARHDFLEFPGGIQWPGASPLFPHL